jgi:hypothetical protein
MPGGEKLSIRVMSPPPAALRKALAEFGRDATPVQIQDFAKENFGIEMTTAFISKYKSKVRNETANGRAAVQPSAASTTEPRKTPAEGMTKAEAVRQAVAELGKDAKRTQLRDHIQAEYGIEMSLDHISVEKRKYLKKKAKKRKLAAAKPPALPSAARTAEPKEPTPEPAAPQEDAICFGDIEATKGLMERVGADRLKRLIDVLAR